MNLRSFHTDGMQRSTCPIFTGIPIHQWHRGWHRLYHALPIWFPKEISDAFLAVIRVHHYGIPCERRGEEDILLISHLHVTLAYCFSDSRSRQQPSSCVVYSSTLASTLGKTCRSIKCQKESCFSLCLVLIIWWSPRLLPLPPDLRATPLVVLFLDYVSIEQIN